MADPTPVLKAVDAQGGSHPWGAVARGDQLPDPVQPAAHRGPGFAVVFQKSVPAAGHQFARRQATQDEDARVRVPAVRLKGIRELAVPIEDAGGGTAQPDLSASALQHRPHETSLPFLAQFQDLAETRAIVDLQPEPWRAFHLAAHPDTADRTRY